MEFYGKGSADFSELNPPAIRVQTITPFILLFCIYVIIGSYGYGNDNDTYGLLRSGNEFLKGGGYTPSRYPGYFIPEIIIAGLSILGGSFLSNLLSSILGSLTLYLYWLLLKKRFNGFGALIITLMVGFNPYFMIAASSSIDYIYSIFFALCGISAFLRNRLYIASFLFALSISSRLGNILIVFFIYLYFFSGVVKEGKKADAIKTASSAFMALTITLLFFLPAYIASDNTFGFFRYHIENWTFLEHLARFAYKNIYHFGLVPFLLAIGFTIIRVVRRKINKTVTLEVLFCLLIVAIHELLFLKIPLEISYLLPLLFIIIPYWTFLCRPKKLFMYGLLAATISYGFMFNLDILDIKYNDTGNVAVDADIGVFIRPGVILKDVRRRPASETLYFNEYNLR